MECDARRPVNRVAGLLVFERSCHLRGRGEPGEFCPREERDRAEAVGGQEEAGDGMVAAASLVTAGIIARLGECLRLLNLISTKHLQTSSENLS